MDNDQLLLFDKNSPPLPPGEYIRDELNKRDWGQAKLAEITGRPLPAINEIIMGKRQIMPNMAVALSAAFGTTPDIWMVREAAYRLSKVEQNNSDVSTRAKVYELAPIKEMEKRNWINQTRSVADTEKELCRFFRIKSIYDEPSLVANTRKTATDTVFSPEQKAWVCRAEKLARTIDAKNYSRTKVNELIVELRNLSKLAKCVEDTAWLLPDYGIRVVIIEPISRNKMDGAAFWLDDNSPVIALSMRYDRLDYFWFTLMHELAHIYHKDGLKFDQIYGENEDVPAEECENKANEQAASWLVNKRDLDSFILRVRPFLNKKKIIQFSNRIGVHPAIVVGQLQHRGEIPFTSSKSMLVKVRDLLTNRILTDGWGNLLPVLD